MTWKTIYDGPLARVLTFQAVLEGHGFPTHVLNENSKTTLPFSTGFGSLDIELQVLEEQLDDAKRVLADLREAHEQPSSGPRSRPRDEVEAQAIELGRRACFCAIILPPLGLLLAWLYFVHTRDFPEPLPGRRAVTVALWLSVLVCLVPIAMIIYRLA